MVCIQMSANSRYTYCVLYVVETVDDWASKNAGRFRNGNIAHRTREKQRKGQWWRTNEWGRIIQNVYVLESYERFLNTYRTYTWIWLIYYEHYGRNEILNPIPSSCLDMHAESGMFVCWLCVCVWCSVKPTFILAYPSYMWSMMIWWWVFHLAIWKKEKLMLSLHGLPIKTLLSMVWAHEISLHADNIREVVREFSEPILQNRAKWVEMRR